jgi:hypothetical protein
MFLHEKTNAIEHLTIDEIFFINNVFGIIFSREINNQSIYCHVEEFN